MIIKSLPFLNRIKLNLINYLWQNSFTFYHLILINLIWKSLISQLSRLLKLIIILVLNILTWSQLIILIYCRYLLILLNPLILLNYWRNISILNYLRLNLYIKILSLIILIHSRSQILIKLWMHILWKLYY